MSNVVYEQGMGEREGHKIKINYLLYDKLNEIVRMVMKKANCYVKSLKLLSFEVS